MLEYRNTAILVVEDKHNCIFGKAYHKFKVMERELDMEGRINHSISKIEKPFLIWKMC